MRIGLAGDSSARSIEASAFEESYRLRKNAAEEEQPGAALQKVEEAQEANTKTTLQMMDRHHDMVRKSQELHKEREKRRALERRSQEHREEQRALLAEMALRNAERRGLLETARSS
jgi:hypothetical protein